MPPQKGLWTKASRGLVQNYFDANAIFREGRFVNIRWYYADLCRFFDIEKLLDQNVFHIGLTPQKLWIYHCKLGT
jgi:hypothetical protein